MGGAFSEETRLRIGKTPILVMLADDERIRVKGVLCRTVEAFMLKPGREEG